MKEDNFCRILYLANASEKSLLYFPIIFPNKRDKIENIYVMTLYYYFRFFLIQSKRTIEA